MKNKNLSALTIILLGFSLSAFSLPDWPDLYDTAIVPELNVKLRQSDWQDILVDETFDIEVPALLWASDEGAEATAILVSIRRKSATPINGKVSLKIDINEYEGEEPRAVGKWHGIKKLSLENGDDVDVVSEGLAWQIHQLAATESLYPPGHIPGKANWATLTVHLAADCAVQPCGFEIGETLSILDPMIYLNVEQPDKQYLKNRNLWFSGETWLYKQDEHGLPPEVKEAGCEPEVDDSPATLALDCAPFLPGTGHTQDTSGAPMCDLNLVDRLVDMPLLLAQGAADALAGNPDGVFTHVKNFYAVDFSTEGSCSSLPTGMDGIERQKRLHFTWDLDEALANKRSSIYGKKRKNRGSTIFNQNGYQNQLLVNQEPQGIFFRKQFNENVITLTEDGFIQIVHNFLDEMEALLSSHLIADPNSKVSNPSGHFRGLKSYMTNRAEIIREEVCADAPSLQGC